VIACDHGCSLRDRHRVECADDQCAGCLSRPALDGLRVCSGCERKAMEGLRGIPELYVDLGDPRRGGGIPRFSKYNSSGPKRPEACPECDNGGSCGRKHREAPPIISDAARDARSAIRAGLVSWCLLLEEERRITLPEDDVRAMATHVHRHAQNLLASPEHADQLVHDVTFWGEARLVAYRVRPDLTIACECGGRVKVDLADVMTCRACGSWGEYTWWAKQGVPEQESDVATAQDIVDWLIRAHDLPVTYGTLRQWRLRYKPIAAGRDAKSRALYDKAAVLGVARRLAKVEAHERPA
jgi:hypothetical protein